MPTLFRFISFCAVIAAIVYGAMFSLATFVEPRPRDVTVRVPPERLNPAKPATPSEASAQ